MKAVVTGGTGFLGRVLVRRLLAQGVMVRVLVRQAEDECLIRSWQAVPVRGDLTMPGGCAGLVEPGEVIFHCAARVDMTGPWSAFYKTTVEGTRRLLRAALPQKPARFVYVSSAAVYAPPGDGKPISADRSTTRPPSYNYYGRAKLQAEQIVRSRCEQAGCPWTIMRLGFMYGPENRALVRHFAAMAKLDQLLIIGAGQNRIATLYVDDAVQALIAAGSHPNATGKIYDVASEEAVTQGEYLKATADALGLPQPTRHVRSSVAFAVAALVDLLAPIMNFEAHLSRAMVTLMGADQVVDASRIGSELGWKPETNFTEGMQRMKNWYRQERGAGDDNENSQAV